METFVSIIFFQLILKHKMMTKKIITIIICFYAVTTATAQQQLDVSYMECSYMLTYMKDTVEKTKKVKDSDLRLLIGNKYSKFYSHATFISDSVFFSLSNAEQNALFDNNSKGSVELSKKYPRGEGYQIYKNYEANTIELTELIPIGGYVLCKEPLQNHNWNILNEMKQIAGYKCQKATCRFRGRDYIAWFTRDIPINEGPYKFSGLPGLIVKIYDTKEHYDFELYMVRKVSQPIIFKSFEKVQASPYREVSLKDYITLKKNFLKNIVAITNLTITENGVTYTPPSLQYEPIELDVK